MLFAMENKNHVHQGIESYRRARVVPESVRAILWVIGMIAAIWGGCAFLLDLKGM